MSRNTNKITGALRRKGYYTETILWDPIGRGTEMCGPDGGWYIEVWSAQCDESGERKFIEVICAYSVDEVLDQIEHLPVLAAAGKGE